MVEIDVAFERIQWVGNEVVIKVALTLLQLVKLTEMPVVELVRKDVA